MADHYIRPVTYLSRISIGVPALVPTSRVDPVFLFNANNSSLGSRRRGFAFGLGMLLRTAQYCLEEFPRWRTLDNVTSARKHLMLMRLLMAKLKRWWATRHTRAAMRNTFRR